MAVKTIELGDSGALESLRLRIVNETFLEHEQNGGVVYKGKGVNDRVRVAISGKSITLSLLVRLAHSRAGDGKAYRTRKTLAKLSIEKPITDKILEKALSKKAEVDEAAGSETRGDIKAKRDAAATANLNLRELWEIFRDNEQYAKGLKTYSQYVSTIKKYVIDWPSPCGTKGKDMGAFPPAYFSPKEWKNWITQVEAQSSDHNAKNVRLYTRGMFNRLIDSERLDASHVRSFMDLKAVKVEKESDVNPLSPEQLKQVWDATERFVCDTPVQAALKRDFVRFLILNPRRREETELLTWDKVDFDQGLIAFPGPTRKNKVPYLQPMTASTREILENRLKEREKLPVKDSPYVFTHSGIHPYKDKRLLTHIDCALSGIPFTDAEFKRADIKYCERKSREHAPFRYTLHDMRDTAAELLSRRERENNSDFSFTIIDQDLLLGHDLSRGNKSRKNYSTLQFLERKKEIFSALEDEILKIVAPEKRAEGKAEARKLALAEINRLGLTLEDLQKSV